MFLTLIDQQITKQLLEEGEKKGREETNLKTARWMLAHRMSLDDIADATGLPLETIKELQN